MTDATERRIRYRATAIVARDRRVLLLREPEDAQFHLPGGGVEDGELPISAVSRELYEETGLIASGAGYLFDYCDLWGGVIDYWGQAHHVFRVDADGEVVLSAEHRDFIWWDGADNLPAYHYVRPFLCILLRSG